MNWSIVIKILLAIVAFIVVAQYIAPLLVAIAPPIGTILLIVIYIGILWWLLAGPFITLQ